MKTSFPKPAAPRWFILDAKGKVLGRMAVDIATVIAGKHRTSYVPHQPCGDHVVVVNAAQLRLTGRKIEQKKYYRHTGYFGNLKEESLEHLMQEDPVKVMMLAVKGMLAKNPTREHLLKRLHVYAGGEHDHTAQSPESFPL